MTTRCCTVLFALLIAMTVVRAEPRNALQAAVPGAVPGGAVRGDIKLLHQVVTEIALEAIEGWKDKKAWPREGSTFAKDHPRTIDQDTMMLGLTNRLHPHAAMDGYIRYQLLSYGLDTKALTPSDYGKLVEALPQIVAQPSEAQLKPADYSAGGGTGGALGYFFSGRQVAFVSDLEPIPGATGFDPVLSVAQSGVVLEVTDAAVQRNDRTITMTVRGANANLQNLRRIIQGLNAPGIGFRDQIMDMVPNDNGMRVAALLTDVEQRVSAAEPSHRSAFTRLTEASQSLAESDASSRSVVRRLASDARRLNKAYALVLDGYEARAGQIVPVRSTVRLSQSDMETLLNSLR